MATKVRILIEGVGEWVKGEIVEDHPGLIDMAKKGSKNAATGELIAEFVEDDSPAPPNTPSPAPIDVDALKARAKELGVRGYANMKPETLQGAVQAAEEAAQQESDPAGQQTDPNATDTTTPNDGTVTGDGQSDTDK